MLIKAKYSALAEVKYEQDKFAVNGRSCGSQSCRHYCYEVPQKTHQGVGTSLAKMSGSHLTFHLTYLLALGGFLS